MKPRFPLYLKILLWFSLNLLVLGLVGFVVIEGRFGLDLLVSGPVITRIGSASEAVVSELKTRPRREWDAVLEERSRDYGVRFLLFQDDSLQLAGEKTALPEAVIQSLRGPPDRHGPEHEERERHERESRGFGKGEPRPRREEGGLERLGPNRTNLPSRRLEPGRSQSVTNAPFRVPPPARARFVLRTASPACYWVGMPAFFGEQRDNTPRFCTLLIVSRSLYGGGLFFDAKPIVIAGGWVLLFSVLFWLPMIRGITRSLGQVTQATERIAQGQFDVRVNARRRDEIGQLAQAVNLMAGRLEGFVTGQKRFLGDTAHELCTPLSRIQMIVGILEQRASGSAEPLVRDLREEVQHMSSLVSELLSFSKASFAGAQLKLQPVPLLDIVQRAVQRETTPGADIRVDLDGAYAALADPELLQRALANLLRNAVKYAGHSGPISVSGQVEAGAILLMVSDCGPGVPAQFLERLFDPFFRVDEARTRESGGVGLGLTIVKTCVEACGGTVACSNRQPTGLEISIRLKPAST